LEPESQNGNPRLSLSRHITLLCAALLFFLLVNAAWLYLDHSIPAWDDAYYLTNSLRIYDALTDNGLPGLSRQFLHGMSSKPPLVATLPIPIYLIVGRNPSGALLINLVFLLVTLAATYLLARSLADRTAGFVALCIVGTMPMIYGLSRIFLVECGLTAFVILALLILVSADMGSSWAPFVLGAIFGLGLLMKISFPIYLVAPMIWVLIRDGRAKIRRGRIVTFLVPLLLIAGPWYAVNASAALRTAVAAGSLETGRVYQTGGLAETGNYLVNLLNCGPTLYFAALPILAILCIGQMSPACRRGIFFCLVSALPIAFLALSHYRDLRYAAPIFPVIAVAGGVLAAAAIARFPPFAIAIVALILAVGTADMLEASFAFSNRKPQGGLLLSTVRFSYVRPPQRAPSPYREILTAMQVRGKWIAGAPHRLVLGSDTNTANADTVILMALAARIPVEVATTAYESPANLARLLASASYFAYVDNAADSPFNSLGRVAIPLVRADPRFHEFASATLPDGSRLHVLEALQ
jgi:4-amino-4-deoxy-L-arabinose transferase-like glycosyltransferase